MNPHFMVKVTKVWMVLIEVKEGQTARDAMNVAADQYSDADIEIDSGPLLPGSEEYERAERHSDEVFAL